MSSDPVRSRRQQGCDQVGYRDGDGDMISVRYVAGRGWFSLARPCPYTGPGGGMFRVIPALPPSGAHPHSFPG